VAGIAASILVFRHVGLRLSAITRAVRFVHVQQMMKVRERAGDHIVTIRRHRLWSP
jgi:hypothetical protein